MKKYALLLVISLLFMSAQDDFTATPETSLSDMENARTATGIILSVDAGSFNFDEMTVKIGSRTKQYPPLQIYDANGNSLQYENLIAPCLVELISTENNGETIPLRITVLEQYQYDSEGFFNTDID